MSVSRLAHHSEVDEFGADIRVDNTDHEGRNYDEREGTFLVGGNTQTAESWGGGVLAQVSEANGWGDNKQEEGEGNQDSEGFGEILWSFHFGDEGGEEDLRYPEESDIQDGVHTVDPGGARERGSIGLDLSIGGVVATVSDKRVCLDTGKYEEEKDREGHEEGCGSEAAMVSKQAEGKCQAESAGHLPENIDMKETWRNVLGKDITIPISITMTEKTTVHCE